MSAMSYTSYSPNGVVSTFTVPVNDFLATKNLTKEDVTLFKQYLFEAGIKGHINFAELVSSFDALNSYEFKN